MAELEQPPSHLSFWAVILTAVMAASHSEWRLRPCRAPGLIARRAALATPTPTSAFVPRDYLWMYPAVVLTVPTMALVECIHNV